MSLIRVNRNPSGKQLLQFAFAWLVFFALLAVFIGWRGAPSEWWIGLLTLAVLVPLVGCWFKGLLRIAYLGMAYLSWPVGIVVCHVILAVIYYLILTPTGIMLRIFKPNFFPKRPDASLKSYWQEGKANDEVEDYFKPY